MASRKITLRDKTTGQLVDVAPEDMEAARFSGRFSTTTAKEKSDYLSAAERERMMAESPVAGRAVAFGEGAARSTLDIGMGAGRLLGADLPTGGKVLADINEALGNDEGYEERQRQRTKAFDVSAALGSVVPDIGLAVATGGIGGAAASAGRSVAARVATTALREGALGALAGTQVEAEQAFRDERDIDRSELLSDAGTGALFGGVLGAAGEGLSYGIKRGADAMRSKGVQNAAQGTSLQPLSPEKIGREMAGDFVQQVAQPAFGTRFQPGSNVPRLSGLLQSKVAQQAGQYVRRGGRAVSGGRVATAVENEAQLAFKAATAEAKAVAKEAKLMASGAKKELSAAEKALKRQRSVAEADGLTAQNLERKLESGVKKLDDGYEEKLASLSEKTASSVKKTKVAKKKAGEKLFKSRRTLREAELKQSNKYESALAKRTSAELELRNLKEELEQRIQYSPIYERKAEGRIAKKANEVGEKADVAKAKKAKDSGGITPEERQEIALGRSGKAAKIATASKKKALEAELAIEKLRDEIAKATTKLEGATKSLNANKELWKAKKGELDKAIASNRKAFNEVSVSDAQQKGAEGAANLKRRNEKAVNNLKEGISLGKENLERKALKRAEETADLELAIKSARSSQGKAVNLEARAASIKDTAETQFAQRFTDPDAAAKMRSAYLSSPAVKSINAAEKVATVYARGAMRPQIHAIANLDGAAAAATNKDIPYTPMETGTGEGLLFEGFAVSSQSPKGTYLKNSDMLAELVANPEKMLAIISEKTQAAMEIDPQMAQEMQQSMMRSVQFMSRYNLRENANPLTGNPNPVVSALDIMTYEKAWDASMDPRVIVNEVGLGTLTQESLEAARFVYPEMTEKLAMKAQMSIMGNRRTTLQQRMQVGLLTSTPDSSLLPEFQSVYNGTAQAAQAEQEAPTSGKPGRNAGSPTFAQSNKTLSESAMSGK